MIKGGCLHANQQTAVYLSYRGRTIRKITVYRETGNQKRQQFAGTSLQVLYQKIRTGTRANRNRAHRFLPFQRLTHFFLFNCARVWYNRKNAPYLRQIPVKETNWKKYIPSRSTRRLTGRPRTRPADARSARSTICWSKMNSTRCSALR